MLAKVRPFFVLGIALWSACIPPAKQENGLPVVPTVRVLLATLSDTDSVLFRNLYVLHSEEARYEFGERNQQLTIVPLKDGIQLYNRNRNLLYRNYFPIRLDPVNGYGRFVFRGKEYDGSVLFAPAADTALYLINQLPVEDYLQGVVPGEINSTRTSYYEAVKAQAICARTYALKRVTENKNRAYDLESTIRDQVYSGYDRHTDLADRAVSETKGICIGYQNELAHVYYHSTCGGRLESAAELWPDIDVPYLAGGMDAVSDTFSCSFSPFFRWQEVRSLDQLDSAFYSNYGRSLLRRDSNDTLHLQLDILVKKRSASGRVEEMEITYGDTTVRLSGIDIRRFFAMQPESYLRSTLFFMTQPDDSTLELHGAGYGHGVGMCQYGAMKMSVQSFHYYHILSKYFPGTTLIKKY
jgi:stage II sporulation protein D